MGNFTLRFQNQLEQELVTIRGTCDPLVREFSTASAEQYEEFLFNQEELVPPCVDFLLDGNENILPELSNGKRNIIHSICLLPAFMGVMIEAVCEFL